MGWYETATMRWLRAPRPCAASAKDRDRAEGGRVLAVRSGAPSLFAQARSAAGRFLPAAPIAGSRWGQPSLAQRHEQEQHDECREHEAEIAPYRLELHDVDAVSKADDQRRDGRIKVLPYRIAHRHIEPGGARLARRRHIDPLARHEDGGAKNAPDRLSEAAGRVLGLRTRVREAAIP